MSNDSIVSPEWRIACQLYRSWRRFGSSVRSAKRLLPSRTLFLDHVDGLFEGVGNLLGGHAGEEAHFDESDEMRGRSGAITVNRSASNGMIGFHISEVSAQPWRRINWGPWPAVSSAA